MKARFFAPFLEMSNSIDHVDRAFLMLFRDFSDSAEHIESIV